MGFPAVGGAVRSNSGMPRLYRRERESSIQNRGTLQDAGWLHQENGRYVLENHLLPITADFAVSLGWKYGYTTYGLYETTFKQAADPFLREDLAGYLASPASMRDLGVKQIQALAAKVDEAIRSHQLQTCDPGLYQGQGIPTACTLRPMMAGEEGT